MESGGESGSRRRVVVGVGGGIAAYKACSVIRAFAEAGDDVQVVPTEAALRFVGAATFEALSGHPVSTTVFDGVSDVRHVRIGQGADLIVVVPSTADLLARVAAGQADDLLTATLLVATCPVVLVPAMHTEMWRHPATQRNVATLRGDGYVVMEPATGRLTGKDSGPGRLPELEQIVAFADSVAHGARPDMSWRGLQVLISAGGTHEDIDPVRYIGNRSSGRQGFALAEVAAQRGATVTVVAGATAALPTPVNADLVRVASTLQMHEEIMSRAGQADVVIMAAAVADFRPAHTASAKLKKGQAETELSTISLVENPDILRDVVLARDRGQVSEDCVIVGFAAETGQPDATPVRLGRQKIVRKGCDLLMVNDVSDSRVFGEPNNEGVVLWREEAEDRREAIRETLIQRGTKLDVAWRIVAVIDQFRRARAGTFVHSGSAALPD